VPQSLEYPNFYFMIELPTLVGRKFGKLTVLSFSHTEKQKRFWNCECKCGNVVQKYTNTLTNGRTKSCGCLLGEVLRKRNTTHGQTIGKPSSEYLAWQCMFARCYNPNTKRFKNHGGRGIKVCKRWYKFENFFEDMGNKPTPLHSLDRYPDNDGNYTKSNCRWATQKQQCSNRRSNMFIEFDGKNMIQADWAALLNISPSSLCVYIKKYGVEKAMLHYAKK
jgi:hypothetical protein